MRVFESLGSTQDEALRWARAGGPEGALVVAERQTSGRGRAGRSWDSPPGRSLYLSIVVRPPPELAPGILTTAVGLGVAEAIETLYGLSTRLKWPNDVMVGARKVAGVLVESELSSGRITAAAVGIGVNVAWTREEFPDTLRDRATSIFLELGRPALDPDDERVRLLVGLLQRVAALYRLASTEGGELIVKRATARSDVLGRRVVVRLAGGQTIEGVATRLLADGALEVKTPEGTESVGSGEVAQVRAR